MCCFLAFGLHPALLVALSKKKTAPPLGGYEAAAHGRAAVPLCIFFK
jgi:hypothetical protein